MLEKTININANYSYVHAVIFAAVLPHYLCHSEHF